MTHDPERRRLIISPTARRQLAEVLPASVAWAAHEFLVGSLLDNPHRLGKRLQPPLQDRHSARRGTYRIVYGIDDEQRTVTVLDAPPGRLPHQGLTWIYAGSGRVHPGR